jgi:hypothetical protein
MDLSPFFCGAIVIVLSLCLRLTAIVAASVPKDLPLLVAAVRENCPWLLTFNLRHYQPGHPDVTVTRPGDFVLRVRELLTRL